MPLTNRQYDDIRRIYDDNRMRAEREADERLADICDRIPQYKKLSEEIAELSLQYTKRALAGDRSAPGQLSEHIEELGRRKLALLKEHGIDEDYIKPRYSCPECRDTGYVDGIKCRCFRQKEMDILYEQSNLIYDPSEADFEAMSERYYHGEDLDRFLESKQKAMNFVRDFNSDYQNLLFYGTVGTGKSMLSSCVAGRLLREGHSVLYFSAATLIDELAKSTFDKGGSRYDRTDERPDSEPIYDCELLIIDDLGTEITNSFTVAALFSLLNERALKRRSIIISTNLSLEELQERYTDRIFSRLTGGFTFCRLSGPDIRIARKFA